MNKWQIDYHSLWQIAVTVFACLLVIDVIYDSFSGNLQWNLIFGPKNLIQKSLSGLLAGFFFSTSKKN